MRLPATLGNDGQGVSELRVEGKGETVRLPQLLTRLTLFHQLM